MAEDERVDYEQITHIYRVERNTPLSPLPQDFYTRARAYIAELEKAEQELRDERKPVPASARSQIEKSLRLLSSIWEFRTRKLALLAVSQRGRENFTVEGITDEENEFLVSVLRLVKKHADAALLGKVEKKEEKYTVEAPEERKEETGPTISGGKMLIRIKEHIPTFATAERIYTLEREDVVNMDSRFASVLLSRKYALPVNAVRCKKS